MVTITTAGAVIISITVATIGILLLIQGFTIETKLIDKIPDANFFEE